MPDYTDPIKEYAKMGLNVTEEDLNRGTNEIIDKIGGEKRSIDELPTEIPRRLVNRPRVGGMVVPFLATIGKDGKPIFAVVNEQRRQRVAKTRECGICGKAMGLIIYFIGGPRSMWTRAFVDPPMHEECAVYSLSVCPYLRHKKGTHPSTLPEGMGRVDRAKKKVVDEMSVETFDVVQEGRPEWMGLYETNGYDFGRRNKSIQDKENDYFTANPPFNVWWFEGVSG